MRGAQVHHQRDHGQPGDERPFLGHDDRVQTVAGREDAFGGEVRPVLRKGEFEDGHEVLPRLALKIFREFWKDHVLSRILGSAT